MHNSRITNARRGLVAYLILVAVLSAIGEGAIVATGRTELIMLVMFIPALVSAIVRLVRHEGFGDVAFRWTGRRSLIGIAAGIVLPIVVGTTAYGLAWSLGLADLNIPESVPGGSSLGRFIYILFLDGGVIGLFNLIGTTGEEVGWRGYMLLRLIDGKIPHPVLLSGAIWGVWHLPLILGGVYADGPNALASAALFMVGITGGLGVLIARLRLATGSIWPPIVLHAFWNSIIQAVFDRMTTGPQAAVWVGESGLLTVAVLLLLALVITCGFDLRQVRRSAGTLEWSQS